MQEPCFSWRPRAGPEVGFISVKITDICYHIIIFTHQESKTSLSLCVPSLSTDTKGKLFSPNKVHLFFLLLGTAIIFYRTKEHNRSFPLFKEETGQPLESPQLS